MSRIVTTIEIEKEYGVPTYVTRTSIKRFQIKNQKVDGLILIALKDVEKIVFDYYVRQDSYTWKEVATKFKISTRNKHFREIVNSILPHYVINGVSYYPIIEIEDLLSNMEHYNIKKYMNKYYYMEGSIEDFYISNYFSLSEFKYVFEQRYHIKPKLARLASTSQLRHDYPVEQIKLFGMKEYVIHRKFFSQFLEDYYIFYTAELEQNPYRRYEKECIYTEFEAKKFKETIRLLNGFVKQQLSKTKNQMKKAKAIAFVQQYLIKKLNKEIYLYSNDEIRKLITETYISKKRNAELYQFLKYVIRECNEECAFDLTVYSKKTAKVKTEQDFYSEEEWEGYVNFIFDIDLHIEKAFTNPLYAKYWLFTMLQCSLAWRVEDILNMPALQIQGIKKYTLKWFEQNEFTRDMAWEIINGIKKFSEQDRIQKTGAKKHFIILNSFAVATAIGLIICEQYRQSAGNERLFGKFILNYSTMVRQLGTKIEGFSNLKATRTILSFANETASHMDYSGQAVNIASYMRSHIVEENGFTDMTSTYLKSSFDERELLSIPAQMGELGLFGWLYHEILIATEEKPHSCEAELIGIIREDITPLKLEGYSNYLLQEQKSRKEILTEIMECEKEDLKELCTGLKRGNYAAKKDDIYCIRSNCKHPMSQNCEFCKYAIPSIHALYVIGQEASGLLDRLANRQGTDRDRERYSFQLFKLLTILKEAKEEFGEAFVSSFADYKSIREKLSELQNIEKGVVRI